jgi:transposase-like protein
MAKWPPPEGMKETFNHAHSRVRNVIEQSFGVLKMKWRILLNMQKFSEKKQTRIIVACMALHNFIRDSRIADREFAMRMQIIYQCLCPLSRNGLKMNLLLKIAT